MMWPASMLAIRRTVSVNGRRTNVEMNSIGINRKWIGSGAGQDRRGLDEWKNPNLRNPTVR